MKAGPLTLVPFGSTRLPLLAFTRTTVANATETDSEDMTCPETAPPFAWPAPVGGWARPGPTAMVIANIANVISFRFMTVTRP